MANKRRQYTDEERATLVAMLHGEGYTGAPATSKKGSLDRVAQYADIPGRTLRRWFKGTNGQVPDKLVLKKKEELSHKLENAAHLFLNRATEEEVIEDMSGIQLMTACGIAVDKWRLLRGESTQSIEVNLDSAKQKLARLLDRFAEEEDGISESADTETDGVPAV